ncbi:N-6 DNA methylase [Proteiniphilum sp.]|uniref:N-6 DNA methylase n=1 Tax=Proteiniphilum sp. TaxID=1926877 RepID=UPI002B1F93DA|nr:N-6 DNA methylase [Proteiniphilum sp.]MEA4918011.1 N-6 DNA methylase [Proteiniphilum sp.]
MKLHEAIKQVLKEANSGMTAKDIAVSINKNDYYSHNDRGFLYLGQIYSCIKDYPSLFQNINGYIVLVNNHTWNNILNSYEYLTQSLKGIFIQADIQFIIAVLFYYKRLVDINHRTGRGYPIEFEKKSTDLFEKLVDEGQFLIKGFKSIEEYKIAPEGIFEECARLVSKLDQNKIQEIWSIIKRVQTDDLSDKEFGAIYEHLITLNTLDDNKSSLNHTSYSLRQLMVELLKVKDGSSVYDPVAGIGDLLVEVSLNTGKRIQGYGTEINRRIAQLASMNVLMHGCDNIHIDAKDCFEQIKTDKKYDYIVGDLPANGITNSVEYYKLYDQYGLSAPKSGKSFGALVLFALSKLRPGGKAVLTVSDGFLVKKGKEQEIRELLIKNDLIETIISLPPGTLRPFTGAKSSLIILNCDKPGELKGRIHFIVGRISDQTPKYVILDNEEILYLYNRKESFEKNAQIVHIEDLRPNVNLLAESYDAQFLLANSMLRDGKAKLLADLVHVQSGVNPEKYVIQQNGDIPLIKVEKLSKDILDINLNTQSNEGIIYQSRYERNVISEECILVARIGDNLKPTLFKPTDRVPAILPHNNVYALIPNNRIELSIEYLYYQLHSAFIQEQIEKRKQGAVMPYISIAGLEETVIPYMSLEAQHEFVQTQKANLIAEERNKIEERIKALGYKEETKQVEADVIKTLTHQLRPTFSGLNGITKRIERIVQREELGHLKEYDKIELNVDPEIERHISFPENYTLDQLIYNLSKETQHLSDILTNVDKVMNFKLLPEELREENILDFLNEYRAQKIVERNGEYGIEVRGESVSVLLHKTSFKELLDQLLINAEKHAFIDQYKNQSNKVIFIVRYNKRREVVSIEYSNNGKPYELTQKDFVAAFEKGSRSKGSGIGGNYINRVVAAHKGKLIVEENNKKGFSLTIELPTPNSSMYE